MSVSSTECTGDKILARTLEDITLVLEHILKDGVFRNRLSVAQVVLWAANRPTTRVDKRHSLMGLHHSLLDSAIKLFLIRTSFVHFPWSSYSQLNDLTYVIIRGIVPT